VRTTSDVCVAAASTATPAAEPAATEPAPEPPELLASAARRAELTSASLRWPSLAVDAGVLADLELMLLGLLGAQQPRFGADGETDAAGQGAVPRLAVPAQAAEGLSAGIDVALRDAEGVMVAALRVTAVLPAGDGSRVHLAGAVEGMQLPHHPDYPELRLTPRLLRAELDRRGWSPAPADDEDRPERADRPGAGDGGGAWAVWADGLLHTADLDRIRDLQAQGRNVVVMAPVGGAEPADRDHHLRVRCLRAALADLVDGGGAETPLVLVPVRPHPAPPAAEAVADARGGPGEGVDEGATAAWRACVASAYGLAGSVVGPAPGSPGPAELAESADAGRLLPAELTPPRVAAELARARPPRHRRGLAVLFTGLSGSGKSTLAALLACRLLERGDRDVTLLDGDVVRRHLSAGLGFSRADRDANVRRIGFVAAQAAGAGGTVVCAPIAPYASVRAQVRAMVERRGAGFVLVHVSTPLEVCEGRDRKGLYAKARAGVIPAFTGVSDPYEEPADADVVVDTSTLSPDAAVRMILGHLRTAGWLA
jgi:sulfate adenylyltransferase